MDMAAKIIAFLAVIIAVLTVINSLVRQSTTTPKEYPYRKKEYLLSNIEKNMLKILLQVTANYLYVFPKVNMSEIIIIRNNVKNNKAHLKRLMSYTLDFVLCKPDTYTPVLIIKIEKPIETQKKDQNEIFEILRNANIPFIILRSNKNYNNTEISQLLRDSIGQIGEITVS